jgi:hypothetical protein
VPPSPFGKRFPAGTRLTLFSDDDPDRFFSIIKFWMDKTSGGVGYWGATEAIAAIPDQ